MRARVIKAGGAAIDHAGERPLRGEPTRLEPRANTGMGVRDVDIKRARNRIDGACQQGTRNRIVVGDERPELPASPAVASQEEADESAVTLCAQVGCGQSSAQACQQCATVGAERRRVVVAKPRPDRIVDRLDRDAFRRRFRQRRRPTFAQGEAVKAPGILEAEVPVDLPAVGCRVEHRDTPGFHQIVDAAAHQPARQPAAAEVPRDKHHADPGEAVVG